MQAAPAVRQLLADEAEVDASIRFYAARVKRDPGDFNAQNRLADFHLQRLRDTNNAADLEAALRAARASLATVPVERNLAGLVALAQAELFAHEFDAAREHGERLVRTVPGKAYGHQILGDALLELGEYDRAAAAFGRMEQTGGVTLDSETRQGRLAWLRGRNASALRHFANALDVASRLDSPPRQAVAWCHWQLGEVAFSTGDYAGAQRHQRHALTVFANFHRALGGLAKATAARGDAAGAIEIYRRAIERFPDPVFIAALGDLHQLQGRPDDAEAQYRIVAAMARLNQANGQRTNRPKALFDADHGREVRDAYASAQAEYAVRRDIYGADALAWTALKVGDLTQAQVAIGQALRLGTRDAVLHYHAGMIAKAAGDKPLSRAHLERALALSPRFDPLQAPLAARALAQTRADD